MPILFEPLQQWAQHLGTRLGGSFQVVGSLDELDRMLTEHPQELLVLFGPGTDVRDSFGFAAQQRVARPAIGVILLRDELDVATLGHALRSGVREVVPANDVRAVVDACARSMSISEQLVGTTVKPAPTEATAKVITVFAAKGGCGKTTMATNLAVALAEGGRRRVCLVDLDLAFGDVGIMLQLTPDRGIADVVDGRDEIDATLLRALLTPYAPGLDVLQAPVGPAEAERITKELMARLLVAARTVADYVVIDTPPHFTDHVLTALDMSDLYVLVTTPDIPALKNLRLALDMFDLLGMSRENRVVVLNRSDARVGLTGNDIDHVIQVPISAHVPSSRDVPVSINRGVPIVVDKPSHPVSKAIRELALGRLTRATAPKSGRGLRGRISRTDKS